MSSLFISYFDTLLHIIQYFRLFAIFSEYIGITISDSKTVVEKMISVRRDANDEVLNRPEIEEWSDHGLSLMNVSSIARSTSGLTSMSSSMAPIVAVAEPEMASSSKEQSTSSSKPSNKRYSTRKSKEDQPSGNPCLEFANCNNMFSNHSNYVYHFEDCRPISCKWCSTMVSDYDKLKEHMTDKHGLNIYQCRLCHHTTDVQTGLGSHADRNCPMKGLIQCDSCECFPQYLNLSAALSSAQKWQSTTVLLLWLRQQFVI